MNRAKQDLKTGFYDWACLSAQQAAEKVVKALLSRLGAGAFGHSRATLIEELPSEHKSSQEVYDVALELDKAYIHTRYPSVHPAGAPYKL